MKQFLSVNDLPLSMNDMISTALEYKAYPLLHQGLAKGLRIGCIFLNPSLRTRLSTQIAAENLGMSVSVLNAGQDGWALEFEDGAIMNGNTVEHIKDAAAVLGQFFDVLAVRAFPAFKDKEADYSEHIINQFKKHAGIPIISLESATLHPLQSFADAITIRECMNVKRPKVVLTWAPHIKSIPHCVANSFSQWMTAWGEVDFVITHPEQYELSSQFTKGATIEYDQARALEGADFVYVKNWSRFDDYGAVTCMDEKWMLTNQHLASTNDAKVMHCLPLRRNVELSDEVLDSQSSIVTRQAGNRVWAAQAVISQIVKAL